MATNIPIHYLKDDSDIDIEVKHFASGDNEWRKLGGYAVHRDDCYSIIILLNGAGEMELDFEKVGLKSGELGIIAPGQVHSNINAENCEAWMVRVAPAMIEERSKNFIDDCIFAHNVVRLTEKQQQLLCDSAKLLNNVLDYATSASASKPIIYNMLNVVLSIATSAMASLRIGCDGHITSSRRAEIYVAFKSLLQKYVQQHKRPSFYSNQLCISEIYLNEAVKSVTGKSASDVIRHQIILEAKRLLCFTKMSVKEIAHTLGYDDHTYFSRIFRLSSGQTPLSFRHNYLN